MRNGPQAAALIQIYPNLSKLTQGLRERLQLLRRRVLLGKGALGQLPQVLQVGRLLAHGFEDVRVDAVHSDGAQARGTAINSVQRKLHKLEHGHEKLLDQGINAQSLNLIR